MNNVEREHERQSNLGIGRCDHMVSEYDKPIRYKHKREEWER